MSRNGEQHRDEKDYDRVQEDSLMGPFTGPCVIRTAIGMGRKAVCLFRSFRTFLNRSKKTLPGFKDKHEPCYLEILARTPDPLAIGLSSRVMLLKVVFEDASR
jgi:hypothetical protein